MRPFAAAVLFLGGCHSSAVHQCGAGFLCPPDLVCAPGRQFCVRADQLAACTGKMDGASCSFTGAQVAACHMGVCTPTQPSSLCGNGMLDPGEACDGAPPQGKSCLDYGLDAGHVGCTATCDADLSDCRKIGWTPMKSPVHDPMHFVWGTGTSDVWVSYDPGGLLHYDGVAWTDVSVPLGATPVRAVWGTGRSDLWVSFNTNLPKLWHFDGTKFTAPVATTSLPVAMWGAAKNDFFLSDGDHLYHCDGNTLTMEFTQLMANFVALWGSGASDVFAVGIGGWIAHYDGTRWTDSMVGSFDTVWGNGPHDVYAGGQSGVAHYDGVAWTIVGGGNIVNLWASGTTDVFLLDAGTPAMPTNTAKHFDSASWSALPLAGGRWFWGSSARDVFLVGDGPILHYQGASWNSPSGIPASTAVSSIWAPAPNNVWVAGAGGVYRFDGSSWTQVPPAPGPLTRPLVWGSSSNDVYLVGDNVFHWNGSGSWNPVPGALIHTSPLGVWGSGPNDVYVLTVGQTIHFDGSNWTNNPAPANGWTGAIWGSGKNDVFAGRQGGDVFHFDGSGWTNLPVPLPQHGMVDAIFGTGPKDVWFGGANSLAHWDGTSVTVTAAPGNDVRAIWASASNDVFAAGAQGALLHYDGNDWTPVRSQNVSNLYALGGFAGGLWIGGDGGLVELLRTTLPGP